MAVPVNLNQPQAQQPPILVHLARVLRALLQLLVKRDPIVYGLLSKKPPEPREVWRLVNRYNLAKEIVLSIDDPELRDFFTAFVLEPIKAKIDAITPLPHIQFLKPFGGGEESPIATETAEFIPTGGGGQGRGGGNLDIINTLRQMEQEVREFEQQQQQNNNEGE